jgi:N4-gp56 family major capsid protein
MKEDFNAANSGVVTYTEVYDTEPNWDPISESGIWLSGAHLDSRTVSIQLEIHGDILKFSDYNEIVQYVNAGNIRGLVSNKIGQNQVDYLDILARNAFLSHPNVQRFKSETLGSGSGYARTDLAAGDYFNPDIVETIRVHLEENEIPGVVAVADEDVQTIVCVTTPRVIKDIRTGNSSKWLEVHEYAGSTRKFSGEVGMWGGVRFIRTNRLKLFNYGAVTNQSALAGATVVGQGAKQTVDTVYSVGQSTSTRYVNVDDASGFVIGEKVTISDHNAHLTGTPPIQSDGSQETRKIVDIVTGTDERLTFDKPLLKAHADDNWVTHGIDIHSSIFMGGPGVVYGVGERPNVITPPKYDDLMIVNRYGWRGFIKMQLFRPEYFEVVETAGSVD